MILTTEQFQKITICHLSPGNPTNIQTISIGIPALKAYQKHGDYEGECTISPEKTIPNKKGNKKK